MKGHSLGRCQSCKLKPNQDIAMSCVGQLDIIGTIEMMLHCRALRFH